MRWILVLLVMVWTTVAAAQPIDIKIYDAFGVAYQTTNIGERLGAIYNISFDPTMVLILGPSLQDQRVRRQRDIVAELDPDEYGILFAIGTPKEQTYGKGFSLAPNTAASLLPSADAFRVLVIGPAGTILEDTTAVLDRETLIQLSPKRQ